MQGTRLPALIAIIALLALTAAVVAVGDPIGAPAGSPQPDTTPPPPVVGGDDLVVAEVVAHGRGPSFDTAAQRGYPTSEAQQSKLWFHDGIWWGALLAEGTNEYRIHRLDWNTQVWVDTGTVIAERAGTLPDVLSWEDRLYVATGGVDPRGRRGAAMLRYTYDDEAARYVLDSDFPVTLTRVPTASVTLARDASDRLWISYVNAGQLFVTRTDGNDLVWSEPATPDIPELDVTVDAAAITSFEDTVALFWSNETHDRVSFAVAEAVEEGADRWATRQVVVDGIQYADDHINLAVLPGDDGDRVFAVMKTSLDERDNANRLDPQVVLLVREPDGTWLQYLVGRVDDRHSRPIVLLDPENRVVYVVASTPFSGGAIYLKASSIDRISFPTGLGTPLVIHEDAPQVSSATSTKQHLDQASGLVVLGSDSLTGEYHHAALLVDGGGEAIDRTPFEYEPIARRLVFDRFDPFPAGTPLGNGWAIRAGGETQPFIVDTQDGRRVAGTTSAADGSRVRMCKEFHPVGEGVLRLETDVLLSAVGESDAIMAAVRHEGGISSGVQLSRRGVFSYTDGDTVVRTEVPYQPGTWYRTTLTLDLTAGTYDWQVRRADDDAPVVGATGVGLSSAAAIPADEICLQSPTAAGGGLTFLVDFVRVER